MDRKLKLGGLVVLALVPLLIAASGGFPSRPKFSSVGIGTVAPAGTGNLSVAGDLTVSKSNPTVLIDDTTNTDAGYVRFSGPVGSPTYIGRASVASGLCGSANVGDLCIRVPSGNNVRFSRDAGATSVALPKFAAVSTTSAGGILVNQGGVTGISRSGTGTYTIDYTAAGFTQRPSCNVTVRDVAGFAIMLDPSGSTTHRFNTYTSAGAAADQNAAIVCVGI
jgi:hypothetical protein